MGNLSIQTNRNNDIFIGPDGNLAMVTGILALEQDCEHALKAQYKEMFLNPTGGMPTLGDIWQSRNPLKWVAVGRKTLKAINGVLQIKTFNTSFQGEVFSYEVQILTIYSSSFLTISGVLDN